MNKLTKINLTQKDLPIMMMFRFVEMLLISINEILQKKRRYTKKWRPFQDLLKALIDNAYNLSIYLDKCFTESMTLRENEVNDTKIQILQLVLVMENLEDPEVVQDLKIMTDKIGVKLDARSEK